MKLERSSGGVWSTLADQVPCALVPLPAYMSHALVPESSVVLECGAVKGGKARRPSSLG